MTEKTPLTRQFLAFSDSRQTAAFFASYLQNTYDVTLVKRVMTEIAGERTAQLKDGMTLEDFCSALAAKFCEHGIFFDSVAQKQAWLSTLKEMSNHKAKNSRCSLGTLEILPKFDLPGLKNSVLTANRPTHFSAYSLAR